MNRRATHSCFKVQQRTAPQPPCPWPSNFWFKPHEVQREFLKKSTSNKLPLVLFTFWSCFFSYTDVTKCAQSLSPTRKLLPFIKQWFRIKHCARIRECRWDVTAALRGLLLCLEEPRNRLWVLFTQTRGLTVVLQNVSPVTWLWIYGS